MTYVNNEPKQLSTYQPLIIIAFFFYLNRDPDRLCVIHNSLSNIYTIVTLKSRSNNFFGIFSHGTSRTWDV